MNRRMNPEIQMLPPFPEFAAEASDSIRIADVERNEGCASAQFPNAVIQ